MGGPEGDFDWMRDRPDHDRRHAIDASKLRRELGWELRHADFGKGLEATIVWHRRNEAWWCSAKDAAEARYAELGL